MHPGIAQKAAVEAAASSVCCISPPNLAYRGLHIVIRHLATQPLTLCTTLTLLQAA